MLYKLENVDLFLAHWRRRIIPVQVRKKIKALFLSVLWRLGISPIPPITLTPLNEKQLKRVLDTESPNIIEIGCNDGEHTLWFLKIFNSPSLFCFEPEPRALKRFKQRVGNSPSVKTFALALSDVNGLVDFYQSSGTPPEPGFEHVMDGWDLSGSIQKPKYHLEVLPWIKYETVIKVPTVTLDSWLSQNPLSHIDFIWMDVQGAELSVLRGMRKSLSKVRYIYTEYSDHEMYEGQPRLKDILIFLEDFEIVARYPEDVLLRNTRFQPISK